MSTDLICLIYKLVTLNTVFYSPATIDLFYHVINSMTRLVALGGIQTILVSSESMTW